MRIKLDKKDIKYLIFIISLFFLYGLIYYSSFLNSKVICGHFESTSFIRSRKYYNFVFDYKDRERIVSISEDNIKYRNENELNEMDCIKIECSQWTSWFSRIVDKRILKE